jgi:hypothetical protein
MPGMSKRYGEDREVSGNRIESAEPMLGIRLGKDPCQFVRLLKFKFGSPHRHQIVVSRDGRQLDAAFRGRARYLRLADHYYWQW